MGFRPQHAETLSIPRGLSGLSLPLGKAAWCQALYSHRGKEQLGRLWEQVARHRLLALQVALL